VGRREGRPDPEAGRVAFILLGALLFILVPVGAQADQVRHRDPRDTRGRLDIRRIAHGHEGGHAVTHSISMYRAFSSRLLQRPSNRLVLWLWESEDDDWVRVIIVRWRDGRLRAPIWGDDGRVGNARVTRPNRRTVSVAVNLRHLGEGEQTGYYWGVESFFANRNACRHGCVDRAPNRIPRRHALVDGP
jgi:hypothetical protein